jgi:hypothetical protein
MKTELTLSLSGGAARCAFQGGFIFELAKQGFTFDRIYAISGGTISGYFAAIGRAEDLEKVWLQEIPKHAGKIRWYAGAIVNLMSGADGIISRDFVEGLSTNFIQNMPTNLVFRVVSLVDGAEYDLTANDFENLADYRRALYAAVAIPGVFPSINFRTKKGVILDAIDGGLYSPIITTIGDDQPLNIMTHSREVEIKRVDGIAGAAARALYLRDFDRTYIEVGEYPGFPLADPWDFRKKSIATSFFHGQQRAKDWINRQIES